MKSEFGIVLLCWSIFAALMAFVIRIGGYWGC